MTSKKQQHQQQVRLLSSSPPPIPQTDPNTTSPTSSQPYPNNEHPWNRSSTIQSPSSPMETVNDRFIHESGPPTALSILRTQPAFIGKLYKMLEDTTQDLICWSNNGEYFSVYNSALFSRQILPQYFKHNNWQSFVRQLNMYGFSKINEMIHSNLSVDNQTWDFKHPHFKRGDFQSLTLVKRKSVRPSPMSATGNSSISYAVKINTTRVDDPPPPPIPPQDHSEETTGVEHRIMQLDEQVNLVADSVTQLTTELQDIKSLIYKQQAMIYDLANLVQSYHGKFPAAAFEKSFSLSDLAFFSFFLFSRSHLGFFQTQSG
ncbi:HSF-type DNA-binding-domain-containing protein [Chlamydoabsidia padenii]|nr:HSF-type DNA-binding-domain-containing protein [Chlamydoabsidia padenii]